MLKFNGVELTDETILKTRKWFSDNSLACIEEVKAGKVRVNDQNEYFEMRMKQSKEYLEGNHQITITFLQRAYYIQTGECIALLP